MDGTDQLRQTRLRFASEVDRVLDGTFVNMPAPLVRLLDAIDSEPLISAHVTACIDALADGFDAASEVDRVTEDPAGLFGPFPADELGATAMAYLIVQELASRNVKCQDEVFVGYGHGSDSLADIARGFTSDVPVRLIGHIQDHLDREAERLGLQDESEEQAPATDSADASSLPDVAQLVRTVRESLVALPPEDREDAALQLDALEDELSDDAPKQSVVRVLLRGLRAFGGGAPYQTAVAQLAERL